MYQLYEMADSGNCYKVRLLLHQLAIEYQRIPTNILEGESRTAEFLARNPNGRVPLLVLPGGRPLAESNAILCYLAEGSPLLPDAGYERALTLQWLFFEQYSHEPYIATNRFWMHIARDPLTHETRIAENHPKGISALNVMEERLREVDFLVGDYSIADIALYAYTHVAHQGGYDLEAFPEIRRWLARVASQPRHIPIDA
jgi:glutathione S-transferase